MEPYISMLDCILSGLIFIGVLISMLQISRGIYYWVMDDMQKEIDKKG